MTFEDKFMKHSPRIFGGFTIFFLICIVAGFVLPIPPLVGVGLIGLVMSIILLCMGILMNKFIDYEDKQ